MFSLFSKAAGRAARCVVWAGLFGLLSLRAVSVPSYQSPTPLNPEEPLRVLGALAAGLHTPDGVGLGRIDTGFGFTHQPTQGLEWGMSLFGGLQSNSKLFQQSEQIEGHVGSALMGRMLGPVTRTLFMGLQLEFDYNHPFHKDEVKHFAGLGFQAGLPIGYNVVNLIRLYFMPQLLLDRLFYSDPNATDATLFSSLRVGAAGRAGMRMLLGATSLVLEVEPGIRDVGNSKTWYTDFLIGLSSDF